MAANISVREYIRWLPDPAYEPTTTLVLTSSAQRFIDIRIFRRHGGDVPNVNEDVLPSSCLEWAFAGNSSSEHRTGKDGNQVMHATWRHWVDSRTDNAESIEDEGDMFPQGNRTTLERGHMINPATGRLTEYEECWKDTTPASVGDEQQRVCIVLVLHDDDHKARGMVIRLGQYCQGLLRVGTSISLERWEYRDGKSEIGGWKRQARIGDQWLPCGPAMSDGKLRPDGEVKFGDFEWRVVELDYF